MPNALSKEQDASDLKGGSSHNDCQDKVCGLCYCESGYKASRIVSDAQEEAIRKKNLMNS